MVQLLAEMFIVGIVMMAMFAALNFLSMYLPNPIAGTSMAGPATAFFAGVIGHLFFEYMPVYLDGGWT